jgi:hypothetical protein
MFHSPLCRNLSYGANPSDCSHGKVRPPPFPASQNDRERPDSPVLCFLFTCLDGHGLSHKSYEGELILPE